MPPFARKCLILIGAHSVGRRRLKSNLISLAPDRFGTIKPGKINKPKKHSKKINNFLH